MEIKVLGTGCARCKSLDKVTRQAVENLGITAEVTKVEDLQKIMQYGVMRTPALVIDEKVVMYGKVPSVEDTESIIKESM